MHLVQNPNNNEFLKQLEIKEKKYRFRFFISMILLSTFWFTLAEVMYTIDKMLGQKAIWFLFPVMLGLGGLIAGFRIIMGYGNE